MTRDDVIRMALDAGVPICFDGMYSFEMLQRFAALVAQQEREACAKVCGNLAVDENDDKWTLTRHLAFREAADAIRARGNK